VKPKQIRTLVIAPHPDDEILGCGGTLLRRKVEGGEIGWLIVTDMTEQAGWPATRVAVRQEEIERVRKFVSFDAVFNLRLPPAGLDGRPLAEIVAAFAEVFKTFAPHDVLVPHRGDAHSDHRVVFDAASACTKWFRHPSVRRVMAYETVSETEFGLSRELTFRPNYFIDISPYLDRKIELMAFYASEVGDFPFPRSPECLQALARWRGAAAGCVAAEAFELLVERDLPE